MVKIIQTVVCYAVCPVVSLNTVGISLYALHAHSAEGGNTP